MEIIWGVDAGALRRQQHVPVIWDSKTAVNGHMLLVGMSGAGKTHTLRKAVRELVNTSGGSVPRFHVFDVHGDMAIEGESFVMFSEQTKWGINPLKVNPDPHFGGVRKRVQSFIATVNRVMRMLGPKQEACLRNVLYDMYAQFGFKADDPSTWIVDESKARLLSDASDGRLYIDVPLAEKDEAKALGAKWNPEVKCWWIPVDEYQGTITRWPPKMVERTHPSIGDALRIARHILQMSFLGTGLKAITNLELANKAAMAFQRKQLEMLRRGERDFRDEKLEADLARARQKAIEAFAEYANSITTGREIADLIKYDSTDVLKSVVDRLENLNAIGIFKAATPPFDSDSPIWRYNITALTLEERKLFVLFRLEEIFAAAMQRGEQSEIRDVILLDEAHIYADDEDDNIVNTIAKEGRKFGIALVAASQSPAHFTEDFVSSVGTKVILGIDEQYWRSAATKMRVPEDALAWIRPHKTLLVQVKTKGETRNEWKWTVIDAESVRRQPLETTSRQSTRISAREALGASLNF